MFVVQSFSAIRCSRVHAMEGLTFGVWVNSVILPTHNLQLNTVNSHQPNNLKTKVLTTARIYGNQNRVDPGP